MGQAQVLLIVLLPLRRRKGQRLQFLDLKFQRLALAQRGGSVALGVRAGVAQLLPGAISFRHFARSRS